MMASFGVYWTVFGGWFALGFVLSIYIHEMGHVAALMRYGVKASAPLFIPGVGAMIRLKQGFIDPREDARVGLAGPIWGCAAALVCAATYLITDQPLWGALGAGRGLDQPVQPDSVLAARRLEGVPQPDPTAAMAGGHRGRLRLDLHGGRIARHRDGGRRLPQPWTGRPPRRFRGGWAQYIGLVAVLSALVLLPVRLPGH